MATAVAVLWGLALQAYVAIDTMETDSKIAAMRKSIEAMGDDAEVRARLEEEWSAMKGKVLDAITDLATNDGAALVAISAEVEELQSKLHGKVQAEDAISEGTADDGSVDLVQTILKSSEAASVGATSEGTVLGTADLADVDGIIDAARYDKPSSLTQSEGEKAHRKLLAHAKRVLRAVEMQCAIENWRDFLAPMIAAVEKRKDRMLYNYI